MVVHDLKSWPEFFGPVWRGAKTAEIRYDDRRYTVGDQLWLREWEPEEERYTGRDCRRWITHIVQGAGTVGVIAPLRGLNVKFVLLSLREVDDAERVAAAAAE